MALRSCIEAHDAQLGEAGVRDLLGHERLGNHADHRTAGVERRVGHGAHQPDARAAVHDTDAACASSAPARAQPRDTRT
jgi:hypothetical protein